MKVEDELQREHERCEAELRELKKELQQAYDTLERVMVSAISTEKLAAMGRLTAGVAHEVRSPLNVITLRLQMILSDPDTPAELDRQLRGLLEQAGRAAKITQALLDFSRQRGSGPSVQGLNEVVQRTLSLLEYDLRQRNIIVVVGFNTKLPLIEADHDQIQQVVLNLIKNARDALPGGGQIALSTDVVQDGDGKGFVELRVEDTGEGIASEDMDKLFEPFFTTKPEGEGTGLGLSICRHIIKDHGGDLWAESAPGGGAAFVVRLPLEKR